MTGLVALPTMAEGLPLPVVADHIIRYVRGLDPTDTARLDEARTVGERIVAAAVALGDTDAQVAGVEIIRRVERRRGEAPRDPGGRPSAADGGSGGAAKGGEAGEAENCNSGVTVSGAADRMRLSRARAEREAVSDEKFEALAAEARETGRPLTRKAIVAEAPLPVVELPAAAEAPAEAPPDEPAAAAEVSVPAEALSESEAAATAAADRAALLERVAAADQTARAAADRAALLDREALNRVASVKRAADARVAAADQAARAAADRAAAAEAAATAATAAADTRVAAAKREADTRVAAAKREADTRVAAATATADARVAAAEARVAELERAEAHRKQRRDAVAERVAAEQRAATATEKEKGGLFRRLIG